MYTEIERGDKAMKRINMRQARKLYNEGTAIYLLPSKAMPGSVWILPIRISLDSYDPGEFDAEVNTFRYYNCTTETGKRVHFYIEN